MDYRDNDVSGHRSFCRTMTFLLVMAMIFFAIEFLTGCARLKPAPAARYLPGQQYGDGGATACMNGKCPVISQGKQWLKPCK